jgi:hypothetical protein
VDVADRWGGPKAEELVERSGGKIHTDVVHDRLAAMGYDGSPRSTRHGEQEQGTSGRWAWITAKHLWGRDRELWPGADRLRLAAQRVTSTSKLG